MKKIIALSSLLLLSNTVIAQTEVLLYGDDDYPPYAYAEGGEMKGIYTEILKKVAEKMPDYKISFKKTPWKRGLDDIKKGKIFALYPPYARPEKRPFMEYETAILDEELTLYCSDKITKEKRTQWPADYHGLVIGQNADFSSGGDAFWTDVKAGKITVKELKGTEKNLKKLIHGRVDCYLNDGLSIEWALKNLKGAGKYTGEGVSKALVISSEQGYLGIVTDGTSFTYKNDFKEKYNAILSEMKKNGEIEKIVNDFVN